MSNLHHALELACRGFCVIPVRPGSKKPLLSWQQFQKAPPGEELISKWWTENPDANIAVITGSVSGVDILDIDSQEGREKMDDILPGSLETPVCRTPSGGWHYYFKHTPGLRRTIKFLPGCDFLADGGYAVCPPSIGRDGRTYSWCEGLSIGEQEPAELPNAVYIFLKNIHIYRGVTDRDKSTGAPAQKISLNLSRGQRNDSLFSIANSLFKGGMNSSNVHYILHKINISCDPPLSESELKTICTSAEERKNRQPANVTALIKEFIAVTDGDFSVTEALQAVTDMLSVTGVTPVTSVTRDAVRQGLHRLSKESPALVERVGNRAGWYRPVDSSVEVMDLLATPTAEFPVNLPLDLSMKCKIYPGNIIVVAGSKSAAKTTLALNVAYLNMGKVPIDYLSSEAGASETRTRLEGFRDTPLETWVKYVRFIQRSRDPWDLIGPDRKIYIIDYLELDPEKVFLVGSHIRRIHERLKDGICLVCLQKAPGAQLGRGAAFSQEKARAYFTLDFDREARIHTCTIQDVKAPRGNDPRGLRREFKVKSQGAVIEPIGAWKY